MRSPAEAFGDYVVYEQLGVGGMATVHRAETQGIAGFSRQVALKRMLPNAAADASLVKSFIREARLASHLHHANVAQTYELGKVGDVYFIAMELVPGRNLREILKHCAAVAGNMPLPIVMNIVSQICDALDYAHNLCDESGKPLGIIHRDVSPSNVIVSEGGVVKLIDFGIAKAKGQGQTTMAGTIKGKFSYLAPEALEARVDARSDLFALGVIAYELLTNRPLFQGKDDMDTLYRVKDMPILPPSRVNASVPPEIDDVVMTALERDPEKRWQRATALRQALTIEIKRLNLFVTNGQVIEWIDRAFQSTSFQGESEPSISISSNTMELAPGSVPDDFLNATDSLATTVKPSRSKPIPVQTEWHVPSDVSTAPRLTDLETTRPDALGDFERSESTIDDWNAPSAADTIGDRPSARPGAVRDVMGWNATTTDQTRQVAHDRVARQRSEPQVAQRPTPQPLVAQRRTPMPMTAQRPTPQPNVAAERLASSLSSNSAPALVAPSGSRTAPHVRQVESSDAAANVVNVSASSVLAPQDVAGIEPRVSQEPAPGTSANATRAAHERGHAGNYLLAVLVLIAAGGAAAVVYFALPHLT